MASSKAVPALVTRVTRPSSAASPADSNRPVMISSAARNRPSTVTSRWVPPAPGISPSRTSGQPKRTVSSATIRSQASANSRPPPRARPCTAAITGTSRRASSSSTRLVRATWSPIRPGESTMAPNSDRSAPARNAFFPVPVSTTARTSGLGGIEPSAATIPSSTTSLRALTGGLSTRMTAMAPSIVVVTAVMVFTTPAGAAVAHHRATRRRSR